MLSRIIIKRYCHSHGRSKCYENIHKIDSIRQELNEIKEIVHAIHKPIVVIYTASLMTLMGVPLLLLAKSV
jgi:hypothetical protein